MLFQLVGNLDRHSQATLSSEIQKMLKEYDFRVLGFLGSGVLTFYRKQPAHFSFAFIQIYILLEKENLKEELKINSGVA